MVCFSLFFHFHRSRSNAAGCVPKSADECAVECAQEPSLSADPEPEPQPDLADSQPGVRGSGYARDSHDLREQANLHRAGRFSRIRQVSSCDAMRCDRVESCASRSARRWLQNYFASIVNVLLTVLQEAEAVESGRKRPHRGTAESPLDAG